MYSKASNIILGFHGCDKSVRDSVINGGVLKKSTNDYDWLGNGIYFWEADEKRAYEWAEESAKRYNSTIKEPAVIGAVIDLGECLDILNRNSIEVLKTGYSLLKKRYQLKHNFPENKNIGNNKDLLFRYLDCVVIQEIQNTSKSLGFPKYDSVRGLFVEGDEVYPGSGFKEKTHIQICVVNPNCIKGYFIPRKPVTNFSIP